MLYISVHRTKSWIWWFRHGRNDHAGPDFLNTDVGISVALGFFVVDIIHRS